MNDLSSMLKELFTVDFTDGTLVEYYNDLGFEVETGRATILEARVTGKRFTVDTDGEAYLDLMDIKLIGRVKKEGNVFYIEMPLMWNYALAPQNVKIPKKPSYEEYAKRKYWN